MTRLELFIPGPPRGQGRPRFARAGKGVRTYPDEKTATYAAQVQTFWEAAGRPFVPEGPYFLYVFAHLARPKTHLRVNGELSAAGLRSQWPTRKPDASNILKLIEDALCAVGALPDDASAVLTYTSKKWADENSPEGVLVHAQPANEPLAAAATQSGER